MQVTKFTNADAQPNEPFEGPEKTLRMYFEAETNANADGLLLIPRKEWEPVLDDVHCKVLSVLVHPRVHAYVLSESSLFVYPQHLVLKTCGTTTLIDGLAKILEVVRRFSAQTGVCETPKAAFYARRSYFRPERQCHPHGQWESEVSRLQEVFQQFNFSTHFGVSKDERWHFFCHAPPPKNSTSSDKLTNGFLELMMAGLDEESAARFTTEGLNTLESSVMSMDSVASAASAVGAEPDDDDPGHSLGNVMTRQTEIDAIYQTERQTIDSFAFSPCGYSCNGVLLDRGTYFTIHVTPEAGHSYASFETNELDPAQVESGLKNIEVVRRVLQIFAPEKITFVVCVPRQYTLQEVPDDIALGYECTSQAEFDVGVVRVMQCTLRRRTDF